jgi:hypothetical protein
MDASMVKAKRGADDPPPWQNSVAEALLRLDILDGSVDETMKPKQVFQMRIQYAAYGLDKFRQNLSTLRESIKIDHAKAVSDSTDLAKDRRTRPPPTHTSKGYPRWDGSDAARFLKEDADKGLLQQLKPSELRETRQEYKLFPAKVFRDHIHQEKRGRTSKSYWMVRKQQQQQAKK